MMQKGVSISGGRQVDRLAQAQVLGMEEAGDGVRIWQFTALDKRQGGYA